MKAAVTIQKIHRGRAQRKRLEGRRTSRSVPRSVSATRCLSRQLSGLVVAAAPAEALVDAQEGRALRGTRAQQQQRRSNGLH